MQTIIESLGVAGAIISTLMSVIGVLCGVIAAQWRHSNRVYSYRLTERDTLNKALSESTTALHAMLHAQTERNTLMEEQADLISEQSRALEILRVMLLAQYEQLRDHQNGVNMAVSSIAESMRNLHTIAVDNRNLSVNYVNDVKGVIKASGQDMVAEIKKFANDVIVSIQRRRKSL